MSRFFKIPTDQIRKILEDIECDLRSGVAESRINIHYELPKIENIKERNKIIFSTKAYFKMLTLVNDFTTEVQWHGLVERIDDLTYRVSDILLFPHEVTGATVTSDQAKYEEWLMSLEDDELNHLRFHGHSHVSMAVTPSSVDMTYRCNLVRTISPRDDNPFYIFMIINKSRDVECQIYDVANNIIYDKTDIDFEIEFFDDVTMKEYLEKAHELAYKPQPPPPPPKKDEFKSNPLMSTYGGNSYSNGFTKKQKKTNKGSEDKGYKGLTSYCFDGDDDFPDTCKSCEYYNSIMCYDCYGIKAEKKARK